MTDLKQINLTDKEFNLIISALDQYPNQGKMASFMADMLLGSLIKDEEKKNEYERSRKLAEEKQNREKEIMIEDIKILQAKLISLKRFMAENSLMSDVKNIIDPTQNGN